MRFCLLVRYRASVKDLIAFPLCEDADRTVRGIFVREYYLSISRCIRVALHFGFRLRIDMEMRRMEYRLSLSSTDIFRQKFERDADRACVMVELNRYRYFYELVLLFF